MRKSKVFLLIITIILVVTTPYNPVLADDILEDEYFIPAFSSASPVKTDEEPKINAGAAIVIDMESGRVLYEKDGYTPRKMASTTKIMTAIVALERGNPEDVVTVSERAAGIWGSRIGLKKGQKIKLIDLLYGLMLNSGNDAAIAIAEHIGGTVEKFADMMNEKAYELGAINTNFITPHGLDVDGHYTTPYDLAVITAYALRNPTFSKIVGTVQTTISYRSLHNTNEMLGIYPGADGVKTGYTGKAGRCLVTSATRDNWRIISVVLNCPSRNARAQSSKAILDYAFNNYKPHVLLNKGDKIASVPVIKGIEPYVSIEPMEQVKVPLRTDEIDKVERYIELPEKLEAPVYKGTEVGYVHYMINDEIIGQSVLITNSDVRRKGFMDYLSDIFTSWARLMREGIFGES
ncbi:MAG TPA: D-alanyl-D-alanine carboxypeptidase [Clostridiaceae bacterium]|nr:D-alanyl-D-alanine carboxypeptidase [Clostridiaceae bacterium]